MKKSLITLAVGAAMAAAGTANALVVNPDGVGGGNIQITGIDWLPASLLVTPTGELGNVSDADEGDVLQAYAQASIATFTLNGSGVGSELSGTEEWTFVTGFQETVLSLSNPPTPDPIGNNAFFINSDGGDNYFEIYYSSAAADESGALTGDNFAAGQLILSGSVLAYDITDGTGASTFSVTGADGIPQDNDIPLDGFNADNYPAIDSITGTGGGKIKVEITSFDDNFFVDLQEIIDETGQNTIDFQFDTQQNLNFTQTDPNSCMYSPGGLLIAAGNGYGSCDPIGTPTGSLGAANGIPGNGPNELLQTDSANVFPQSIPEPSSLALLGMGLLGMGAASRRRQRAKS